MSLARALNRALGARPVFVAEPGFRAPIERCAAAAGLRIVSGSDVEKSKIYHAAQAIDFPLGPEGAGALATRLLDDYRPAAILAVERLGPNAMDIFHSGVGYRLPAATQAHVHLLVDQAEARGILTIGFGDSGNEVGYGLIPDVINALKADVLGGMTCQCGCGGGIATRGAPPSWSQRRPRTGAVTVSARFWPTWRDLDALQDEDMEYRMLEAAVMAGAVDASTGTVVMKVDGTSVKANQAIVTLLRELVANTLREPRPRLFPKEIKEILSASA